MATTFRRLRTALLSALIAATAALGLAAPAHASLWSDYGIPNSGILVPVSGGTQIQAISPTCASQLLVHLKSGATLTYNLDSSQYYYPTLGVTSCYTFIYPTFGFSDVASYAWWTASGDIPVDLMSAVQVDNVQATPRNHQIALTWNTPDHANWVRMYQFAAWHASTPNQKQYWAVNAPATSYGINVPVNADDWIVTVTPTDLWGNGVTTTLSAASNIAPQAPARLSLIPGDNQIQVLLAPTSPDDAVIHHYDVTLQPGNIRFTMTGNQTSATITNGISNNVSYQATAIAVNAAGTSGPSDSNVVTTRATPRTVGGVEAHAYGAKGARVSWSPASGDVTGYRITSIATGQSLTVGPTISSVIFDDVVGTGVRSTTYSFGVATINDYLQSTPTGVSANMLPAAPPTIWATGTLHGIYASWSAPANLETDVIGYSVDLVNESGSTVSHVDTVDTSTSINLADLATDGHFRVRVATRTVWGTGPTTLSNIAVVEDVPSAPASAIARQSGSSTSIDVLLGTVASHGCPITSWNATVNGQSQTALISQAKLTFTGLEYGRSYEVSVTATNCWGSSTAATQKVSLVSPPAPVTNVQVALTSANYVDVTWTPGIDTNATAYIVTLSPANTQVVVSSVTTHVMFTNVVLGSTVTASVTARNAVQTGLPVFSSSLLVATAPDLVVNLAFAIDVASASATVTWDDSAYVGLSTTGYLVTVDTQLPFTTTSTSVQVNGLVAGDLHTVTVQAINALGTGGASTVTFGLPTTEVLTPDANGTVIVWVVSKNAAAASTFIVQQKVANSAWKSIAKVKPTTRSYTIKKKPAKATYRVMALVGKKLVPVKSSAKRAR